MKAADAAAKVSQEVNRKLFVFIIQGIPWHLGQTKGVKGTLRRAQDQCGSC
jgi:hypothetical protein